MSFGNKASKKAEESKKVIPLNGNTNTISHFHVRSVPVDFYRVASNKNIPRYSLTGHVE